MRKEGSEFWYVVVFADLVANNNEKKARKIWVDDDDDESVWRLKPLSHMSDVMNEKNIQTEHTTQLSSCSDGTICVDVSVTWNVYDTKTNLCHVCIVPCYV